KGVGKGGCQSAEGQRRKGQRISRNRAKAVRNRNRTQNQINNVRGNLLRSRVQAAVIVNPINATSGFSNQRDDSGTGLVNQTFKAFINVTSQSNAVNHLFSFATCNTGFSVGDVEPSVGCLAYLLYVCLPAGLEHLEADAGRRSAQFNLVDVLGVTGDPLSFTVAFAQGQDG